MVGSGDAEGAESVLDNGCGAVDQCDSCIAELFTLCALDAALGIEVMESGSNVGCVAVEAGRLAGCGCKLDLLGQASQLTDKLYLAFVAKQAQVHIPGLVAYAVFTQGAEDALDSCVSVLDVVDGVFAVGTDGQTQIKLQMCIAGAGIEEISCCRGE